MVKPVESEADFRSALTDNPLVFVDFFATWCGPCKMIAPKLEAMEKEFTKVVFLKVDVDELEDLSQSEEVSAMPTFKLYKAGVAVETIVGASEAKIRECLEKYGK